MLQASGIPLARITEDLYGEVITAWYRIHLDRGGTADPIMDEMIGEDEEEQRQAQT